MVRDVRDMRLKTREREREGERENIYLIRGHVCVCVHNIQDNIQPSHINTCRTITERAGVVVAALIPVTL